MAAILQYLRQAAMRSLVGLSIVSLSFASLFGNVHAVPERNSGGALGGFQYSQNKALWLAPDQTEWRSTQFIARIKKEAEEGSANAQATLGLCYHFGRGVAQDHINAMKWYHKAASNGHPGAQNNLAVIYDEGVVVPRDPEKAHEFVLKAAKQGLALAQYNVGHNYARGNAVPQNWEEAVKWFRKAAAQNNHQALNQLGMIYCLGLGVPADLETAKRYFREPAEAGISSAQAGLGFALNKQGNFRAAASWHRRSAEGGSSLGQFSWAVALYFGQGTKQDIPEALSWARKAAGNGSAEAQALIAQILMDEKGRKLGEPNEAERWARKSAEQQNALGQFVLGQCYALGIGVERDGVKACHWYRLAAEQNHVEAAVALGALLEDGLLVPRNFEESARWYRVAAEKGNGFAQYRLGLFFRDGTGVGADLSEAEKWLELAVKQAKPNSGARDALSAVKQLRGRSHVTQAETEFLRGFEIVSKAGKDTDKLREGIEILRPVADSGHPGAQAVLAGMYRCGIGVPKDEAAANALATKAATTPDPKYLYLIGRSYIREGERIPPEDAPVAVSYFTRAAIQGYPPAQNSLGIALMSGAGIEYDFVEAFKWLSLAASHGHDGAKVNLERLRPMLRPAEIEEAKRRASTFQPIRENAGGAKSISRSRSTL